jgi:hypothetical protein
LTRQRTIAPAFFLLVILALAEVAAVVAQRTIQVVDARGLLPRWDLATHLVLGWSDYHFLATGRVHRLLWDLWLQGYWPPVLSIFQIPFYLLFGGGMTGGLWSSMMAFVLTGVIGCAVLWRHWTRDALLPASLFVALLMSSPYVLAYASVTMTEMLGAAMQLSVILCYVTYRQRATPQTARAFAISLTVLFFTKYNYFFLLAVPLGVCEWLDRPAGEGAETRLAALGRWSRRALASPTAMLLALYVVFLLFLTRTGGFEFHVFDRRIAVHTIGNTGHVVLYLALARLWYLHRRSRIDWHRLTAADPRVRPLLLWFVVPVTIWFASPYPNHIRDFANLVFNRPLGEPTVARGIATYVDALRTSYFYSPAVLAGVLVVFAIAVLSYRNQPSWVRWLIVAIPVQCAAMAFHQTRFPRFLLLTVVLLCLVAASEVGRWCAGSRVGRLAGTVLVPVILLLGIEGARSAVTQQRFLSVAFENYTDSEPLRRALGTIRGELRSDDRLAIVGEGNDLSPALMRWELGPPSGVACSPFQIGGAARLDPALATRVLLMEPVAAGRGSLDVTDYYLAQRQAILARVDAGEFAHHRDFPLDDMQVTLRLYDRVSRPERLVACQ